jgi:hypothetical protein
MHALPRPLPYSSWMSGLKMEGLERGRHCFFGEKQYRSQTDTAFLFRPETA